MVFNFFQKYCTKNNLYPSFEKYHFAPQYIKVWWWRLIQGLSVKISSNIRYTITQSHGW